MADSMQMNALQLVRTAKNTVANALLSKTLKSAQRSLLLNLYWDLEDLEEKLILQDIGKQVKAIEADAEDLRSVVKQIQGTVDELNAVADAVDKAAQAVATLVKIASAAAAVGLL